MPPERYGRAATQGLWDPALRIVKRPHCRGKVASPALWGVPLHPVVVDRVVKRASGELVTPVFRRRYLRTTVPECGLSHNEWLPAGDYQWVRGRLMAWGCIDFVRRQESAKKPVPAGRLADALAGFQLLCGWQPTGAIDHRTVRALAEDPPPEVAAMAEREHRLEQGVWSVRSAMVAREIDRRLVAEGVRALGHLSVRHGNCVMRRHHPEGNPRGGRRVKRARLGWVQNTATCPSPPVHSVVVLSSGGAVPRYAEGIVVSWHPSAPERVVVLELGPDLVAAHRDRQWRLLSGEPSPFVLGWTTPLSAAFVHQPSLF